MPFEALLEEYERRRAKALAGGGADKYAKRTAAGIWNANFNKESDFRQSLSAASIAFKHFLPRFRMFWGKTALRSLLFQGNQNDAMMEVLRYRHS